MHLFTCSLVFKQKEKQIIERKNKSCLISVNIRLIGAWFIIPTKAPMEIVIPKNTTIRMVNFLCGF